MRRTRRSLIAQARRLTAAHGLAGFTVEQLCAEVGISRRTFFNYFATKDDAVLGTPARDPLEAFGEQFVDGGRTPDGPGLLAGLQELVVQSFRLFEGPHDRAQLLGVLRREPALLQRLTEDMDRQVTALAELIARRQRRPAEDPFPRVAAAVVSHLARHTVHEFLETRPATADPEESPPLEEFAALLDRNVRLAAALFVPAPSHSTTSAPTGSPSTSSAPTGEDLPPGTVPTTGPGSAPTTEGTP
ncbi:TetR family transcriptional regulator [Kocuria dechangensis]|uniref:TetR family transcriptional regulator n=2 Tax=Kocuria dechangensis TaxID=1176249 RepID=A0A917M2X6_9MICC|nr:TetR family transcriptional regulator [Kocuria dechangensis]